VLDRNSAVDRATPYYAFQSNFSNTRCIHRDLLFMEEISDLGCYFFNSVSKIVA